MHIQARFYLYLSSLKFSEAELWFRLFYNASSFSLIWECVQIGFDKQTDTVVFSENLYYCAIHVVLIPSFYSKTITKVGRHLCPLILIWTSARVHLFLRSSGQSRSVNETEHRAVRIEGALIEWSVVLFIETRFAFSDTKAVDPSNPMVRLLKHVV